MNCEEIKAPDNAAPAVSFKIVDNTKKGITNIAVVLEGEPLDRNLYVRIRVDNDYIIGRRINCKKVESHPITVYNGEDRDLEILKPGRLPEEVRKRMKAPRKLPAYSVAEEGASVHIP